ncbi:hypothetical protein [Desulfosporosinus youngiae]|uniref:Uncharacterized protein n=1 Tax=Desulfosporosinus youngiae DSM 17734 TaxID=768710 RepID=H5Y3I3_9FIRM|nr:hypothetical protein [Desulfosporosinus youngiae]EHQ89092.1 hypothetical protein DesyoDRAFT_1989 [Desulfosporosinus youngiae DSM 17734]
MKDFWILKVLDFFSFFYRVMGIDYGVMRKILQIKLIMDQRRAPSILIGSKHKDQENTFKKSLIMYGFMGVILVLILLPPLPLFLKMNLIIGILIVMVMMTMVSDFSSILLETRDKDILLSKPIKSQTVNAAKITHILINLLTVTFVMAGPSLIAGGYKYGLLFMSIYFFDLLLISGLILFLTSVLYFLMLLFFDGDKLKDVINYFQIILSLMMMIGYQFTGHVFRYIGHDMVFNFKWWMYLLPSAWFAAPFSWISENSVENHFVYLSVIGVIVPSLLLMLYFGVVIKYFERSLYKLDTVRAKKRITVEKRAIIYRKISSALIPNNLENSVCRFSQNMISSERSIRLRLYPNLGLAIFLPVLIMVNPLIGNNSLQEAMTDISQGAYYLFIYLSVSMLSSTAVTINSSENYKGAWIYKALPIELPGVILIGALKGFILKYVIPAYLFVSLIFAVPYGVRIIPHLIIIFLNMLLLIILLFKLSPNELPFGKKFQGGENNVQSALGSLAFCGISAFLHYALQDIQVGLFIYGIAVLLVSAYLWKTSAKITWKDL